MFFFSINLAVTKDYSVKTITILGQNFQVISWPIQRRNNWKKIQTFIQLPKKLISEGGISPKKHKRKVPSKRYLFKVNNGNLRKRCEMYSKLSLETPEWRHWRRSGVFIVNFEHIPHSSVTIVDWELVFVYLIKCKESYSQVFYKVRFQRNIAKLKPGIWSFVSKVIWSECLWSWW